MDCRRTLGPALWLLTGALGCAHDRGAGPVRETPPPPVATRSANSPSKPDPDPVKRAPHAETCVRAGIFFAGEASALSKNSNAQEQLRERARMAYQQALSIDPNYVPAYQSLGRLYSDMEDYEHALATYHKALQIQPRCGAVWFELGMCQARKKEWTTALESLNRAIECEPENRQYLNTLGFALARTGRYQDSLNVFMRSSGNEAMANYQLARMLHHLKQDDMSRQCAQAALQKDPNLEAAQNLLTQLNEARPSGATLRSVGYSEVAPDAQPAPSAQPEELPREFVNPQPTILPPPPRGMR